MKRYIGLMLLSFCLVSCSTQKQQTRQIKHGIKNIPYHSYFNQPDCDHARMLLLNEIENFVLGSDTLILLEYFVDVFGSYRCILYSVII